MERKAVRMSADLVAKRPIYPTMSGVTADSVSTQCREICYPTAMKCPACRRELKKIKVGSVALDICQGGCGGIWFSGDELDKVVKSVAAGKETVAEITRGIEVTVDEHRVLKCVSCRGVKLEQKLFSLGSGVIMDRCPKCESIWLDHGELETIREETNPVPRPVRHVVERKPKSVPINFKVVREVQKLRISVSGH